MEIVNRLDLLDHSPELLFFDDQAGIPKWREYADRYVNHEFNLLGSGWVKVFYGMKTEGFEGINYSDSGITYESVFDTMPNAYKERGRKIGALAGQLVEGYVPIDWHIDFKSGQRSGIIYYRELTYGLVDGYDAKVPFDLSRFYHLVVLARAWRYTGDERYRKEIMAQILDWIALNPVDYGTNWNANMNVAIRLINWIVAFYMIKDSFSNHQLNEGEREFLRVFQDSVLEHRRYMLANLEFGETSIHPNHYVADLGGLLVGSLFAQQWDIESSALFRLAVREIGLELDRQIGEDGFDYESATSYHAFCLEMFLYPMLIAAKAEGRSKPPDVRGWLEEHLGWARLQKIRSMFGALRDITQPDGKIPLIGDADSGRMIWLEVPGHDVRDWRFLSCVGSALFEDGQLLPPTANASHWTAARTFFDDIGREHPPAKNHQLSACYPNAGFYVLRSKEAFSLVFCGPIGTGGLGGHAHDDKLSFTLCVGGLEMLVDPGVYVYTSSKGHRDECRSVLSHNTVCIDGQPQNRYLEDSPWWGCHEDTRCKCLKWEDDEQRTVFVGQHEGYSRLSPGIIHRRSLVLQKQLRRLELADELVTEPGSSRLPSMEFSYVLHPECKVAIKNGHTVIVQRGELELAMESEKGAWAIAEAFFAPSYGTRITTPRLYLKFNEGIGSNRIHITW